MTETIDINPDEIDSTFQQIDAPDAPTWVGTHTYGDYSVTRRVFLSTERMELRELTKYEHDGTELKRIGVSWRVSERDDAHRDTHAEAERYTVDHSGELPHGFAESSHFNDPEIEIEIAIKEYDN